MGFQIDIKKILEGCGFRVYTAENAEQLRQGMLQLKQQKAALIVRVRPGSREDLGRPSTSPEENKLRFMENIST